MRGAVTFEQVMSASRLRNGCRVLLRQRLRSGAMTTRAKAQPLLMRPAPPPTGELVTSGGVQETSRRRPVPHVEGTVELERGIGPARQPSTGEAPRTELDPLVAELVARLPRQGESWTATAVGRWTEAATAVLHFAHVDGERGETR
jgi:hypothetical protein